MKLARGLVAAGSLLLCSGGLLHSYRSAFVFPKLALALDAGLSGAIKDLWWSFSIEFVLLSFVILRASRLPKGRALVLLCTLIPAARTILRYRLVGPFISAHDFAIATAFSAIGGFLLPPGHATYPASRMW